MKIKCNLGRILDIKGIKRKWVAEQLDVSQQTVSGWIKDKNYPPMDKAFKLARILDVKVDDLYEEIKKEPEH